MATFKNHDLAVNVLRAASELGLAMQALELTGINDQSLGNTLALTGQHEYTANDLNDMLKRVRDMAHRVARPGTY